MARQKPSLAPSVELKQATPPLHILGGTPLSDEDWKNRNFCWTDDAPKAEYAWDLGEAMTGYLQGFKEGRILGRKCRKCDRIMVPPRAFCELCFRPADEWVAVEDTGVVNTFSICYVTWDMKKLTDPQIPAVIEINGASKGMGILHLLGEVDPKKVKVGMKVKAVWKTPSEREGAITDIRYWKPA